jgi:hypothetical protein
MRSTVSSDPCAPPKVAFGLLRNHMVQVFVRKEKRNCCFSIYRIIMHIRAARVCIGPAYAASS